MAKRGTANGRRCRGDYLYSFECLQHWLLMLFCVLFLFRVRSKIISHKEGSVDLKPRKARPRRPHFAWRGLRLYFCIGGDRVAAVHREKLLPPYPEVTDNEFAQWPLTKQRKYIRAMSKVISDWDFLLSFWKDKLVVPTSRRATRRLAILMRKALLRAEEGNRTKSAYRQRLKLDRWLYGSPLRPSNPPQTAELPPESRSAFSTFGEDGPFFG